VPWCDDCSKFWNADKVAAGGQCPTCGRVIVRARPKAPWHFKLLLVAFAGYLVYRLYWFIEWLPKHV
jgi:DNA-directed RNA polymerase subunit RPC12/RpoP